MSMQAINYAMTLPVDEPGPRLLLFVIAHHVNWKTGKMYVGQKELSDEVRSSVRSVRRWLIYLEETGFITRTKCRDEETGRQDFDEIELLGYLEWQDVLYNGGTLPHPSTRGKPVQNHVEEPEDNLAAGDDPSRTNEGVQADKSGGPGGHCCPPLKEPLRTIGNPKGAHARAKGEFSDLKNGSEPKPVRPAIDLTPADASWQDWLSHIEARGHEALAQRAKEAGRMQVPARWPERAPVGALPNVPKPPKNFTDRMIGEPAA